MPGPAVPGAHGIRSAQVAGAVALPERFETSSCTAALVPAATTGGEKVLTTETLGRLSPTTSIAAAGMSTKNDPANRNSDRPLE
jgi:hypothetical protein